MKNLSVRNEDSDIPCKADVDSRLNNVPNVKTNDQTPTYSTAAALAKLVAGEKLGAAFGKIAKAVEELITHLSDGVKHITAAERTAWNGKAAGNHTHSNMTAATASAAGKAGLVPAPAAGSQGKYLRGDGTWQTPPDTNTTYSAATQSANGLMSAADKTKLDGIATGANKYTHPTTAGNKHIPSGGSSGQILRWSADGTAAWGNDNNTTYSNMTAATASAAGRAGLVPAPAAGAQAKFLRGDGTWQTPPDTNTTYSAATQNANGLMSAADKTKLDGIATGANKYTHPATAGNKHIPSGGSSGQILRWSADGTAVWGNDNNTTYSNMKGASASANGAAGLVPAPTKGNQTKYLRADGTWQTPPDTNTTYGAATASAAGLMSAADKKKLDGGYMVKSDSNGLYVEY